MTLDARLDATRGGFRLRADLTIEPGEVVAVLGPNGSGKTTTLHVLAGLLALDDGRIRLDDTILDDPAAGVYLPPDQRPVSVVFQDYLLFPHLDVLDNVAFGLLARGAPKRDARARAREWLARLDLAGKAAEKPQRLSGGEAQRVALARALAPAPLLLLLDEPLAALDAGTRTTVRRDLRRHLDSYEGVTLLVTHDPLDAIALASRIVILEAGHVTQSGPIDDVTTRPRSRYVADLIGLNLLHGVAHAKTVTLDNSDAVVTTAEPAEGRVNVLIHPNAIALHTTRPGGSPRNQWPGHIDGFDLLGDRVRVRITGALPLVAEITPAAVTALGLLEGQPIWTAVKATEITTYPA